MSLAPRVVLVHRRTELDEAVARYGTLGQASFVLAARDRPLAELRDRHDAAQRALATVAAAIPADWRRGRVERADLPRFAFEPHDVVVVVGQDGLVANAAKYLDGQAVIGVDPEPGRNAGVLVTHPAAAAETLVRAAVAGRAEVIERVMVRAATDDGQVLLALNEIYVGHAGHQTARYRLRVPDGRAEAQASSGVIVATGTGATGWCQSIWRQRGSTLTLPGPAEARLSWFVREAWASPSSATSLTEGELAGSELGITIESDHLVAFGDGIEADFLELSRGQRVTLGLAGCRLRSVR